MSFPSRRQIFRELESACPLANDNRGKYIYFHASKGLYTWTERSCCDTNFYYTMQIKGNFIKAKKEQFFRNDKPLNVFVLQFLDFTDDCFEIRQHDTMKVHIRNYKLFPGLYRLFATEIY